MSVLDKSLDSKILASAKKEFLQNTFAKANLRKICEEAGVSTGAVYTRYQGKEGLFGELVKDTIIAFDEKIQSAKEIQPNQNNIQMDKNNFPFFNNELVYLMDFIYQHYDGFRLLSCCAKGSKYDNFLHTFIEANTENIWDFLKNNATTYHYKLKVNKKELHLMLTTFWTAIFEPISHEFSKDKALHYCEIITNFFHWQAILEMK